MRFYRDFAKCDGCGDGRCNPGAHSDDDDVPCAGHSDPDGNWRDGDTDPCDGGRRYAKRADGAAYGCLFDPKFLRSKRLR